MLIRSSFEEGKNPLQGAFQIHIPQEEVTKSFHQAYQRMRHSIKIDGFRKGKVSKTHLQKLYGPQIALESTESMATKAYKAALEEHDILPLGDPQFLIPALAQEEEGFNFGVEFELCPDFSSIQYTDLELPPSFPLATEEDIEKKVESDLKNLCEGLADYKDVEDESAEATEGHVAILNLKAMNERGEAIKGFPLDDLFIDLKDTLINKNFMKHLLGRNWKEPKEFELDLEKEKQTHYIGLPNGDVCSLKGHKKVRFYVEIKSLKTKHLSELNDAFAQEYFKLESLSALKEKIRDEAREKDKNRAYEEVGQATFSAFLKKNPFELPPRFLKKWLAKSIEPELKKMEKEGFNRIDIQKYFQRHPEKKEAIENAVEEQIKLSILMEELATENKICFHAEDLMGVLDYLIGEAQEAGDKERLRLLRERKTSLNTNKKEQYQLCHHITQDNVLKLILKKNNFPIEKYQSHNTLSMPMAFETLDFREDKGHKIHTEPERQGPAICVEDGGGKEKEREPKEQ